MKTYDIEIQRVKSMHQGHGLVYMRLDAAVQQIGDLVRGIDGFIAAEPPAAPPAAPAEPPAAPAPANG